MERHIVVKQLKLTMEYLQYNFKTILFSTVILLACTDTFSTL